MTTLEPIDIADVISVEFSNGGYISGIVLDSVDATYTLRECLSLSELRYREVVLEKCQVKAFCVIKGNRFNIYEIVDGTLKHELSLPMDVVS